MLPDLRVGRMTRTPLPLSAARTRPGGSREAARRPDGTTTMGRGVSPLGAVSGTDGNGHGHDAVSRPHRREGSTLPTQKRPCPPLSGCQSTIATARTGEPSAPSTGNGRAMNVHRGTPIWSRFVRYSTTVTPAGKNA